MSLSLVPHSFSFTLVLISSTALAVSSSSLISLWMALELNLLSLIPLMLLSRQKQETEAAMKYFLAQAFGSCLLLLSYPLLSHNPILLTPPLDPATLTLIALTTKLGAAPTHFWFPSVMANSPWPICAALATLQKITPLCALSLMINPLTTEIALVSATSALTGGVMGLNQTSVNTILAYSSIAHLGWMVPLTQLSSYVTISYFLIYSMTALSLMILLHLKRLYSLSQALSHTLPPLTPTSSALLLSLGGLPPLLGFSPKLLTLKVLTSSSLLPITPFLILASTLSLSYYLTLSFNSFMLTSASTQYTTTEFLSEDLPWVFLLLLPLFCQPFLW